MSEFRRPSSLPPLWVVLTIPVVTVFCREKGLPMATTNSPGRRSAERPSSRTGSFICADREGQYGGKRRMKGRRVSRAKQEVTLFWSGSAPAEGRCWVCVSASSAAGRTGCTLFRELSELPDNKEQQQNVPVSCSSVLRSSPNKTVSRFFRTFWIGPLRTPS